MESSICTKLMHSAHFTHFVWQVWRTVCDMHTVFTCGQNVEINFLPYTFITRSFRFVRLFHVVSASDKTICPCESLCYSTHTMNDRIEINYSKALCPVTHFQSNVLYLHCCTLCVRSDTRKRNHQTHPSFFMCHVWKLLESKNSCSCMH